MSDTDPFAKFDAWFAEAVDNEPINPNAMTLATATADGVPNARMVLLKGHDTRGFTFFTNTLSPKGAEIEANPQVALCFYWRAIGRQIRIAGRAEPVTAAEADAYFATRPRGSQVGAWASEQSRTVDARATLERRVAEIDAHYANEDVPRPPHWSGYRVVPARIEFWVERRDRLHDRELFERDGEGWRASRLQP